MLVETCWSRDCLNDDLLTSYQCVLTLYLQNIYASVARITTFLWSHSQCKASEIIKHAHPLFLQQNDKIFKWIKKLQLIYSLCLKYRTSYGQKKVKPAQDINRDNAMQLRALKGHNWHTWCHDCVSLQWSERLRWEHRVVPLLTSPEKHGLLLFNMSTLLLSEWLYQILTTQCRCWQAPRPRLVAAKSHHGIHPKAYLSSCFACSGLL